MTISAELLLAAYPHCQQAVAFVEEVVDGDPGDGSKNGWDWLMASGEGPSEVMEGIRWTLTEGINAGDEGRLPEALLQTEHPSFLTYLQGKMGAY